MEMPGTGTRKYDSKKALPAPNRKVARTTLAGSRRLSIEAIVQRTSIEGAMAAAPRVDGRAAITSLARRYIGWLPIKEELSPRTAYWQSFNGCCRWPEFIGCSCPNQCLLLACGVKRRRFPVGASPTRQPLQPEAIGAVTASTQNGGAPTAGGTARASRGL